MVAIRETAERRFSGAGLTVSAACLAALLFAGCSQNPYLAPPGGVAWQGQPSNVAPQQAQIAELSRRVRLLDDNNRQLTTRLAQSEQQAQVYRDELELVRKQLADTTRRFEEAKIAANNAEQRARSFQASTQLRGGASIRPNTNFAAQAKQLKLGGVPVETDGDKIRIVVAADRLFQPGTAQLLPQAAATLDPIAAQLRSLFPERKIGVEAYSDNRPVYGGASANTHQLTAAQAAAVLDLLTRRGGMPPDQLFTAAYGANHPRQTNESAAGRAANRRVELVIYPESF